MNVLGTLERSKSGKVLLHALNTEVIALFFKAFAVPLAALSSAHIVSSSETPCSPPRTRRVTPGCRLLHSSLVSFFVRSAQNWKRSCQEAICRLSPFLGRSYVSMLGRYIRCTANDSLAGADPVVTV